MSVHDVEFERPALWPSNGISEVPFRLYTDPEQYALEQERIFKGPTWNYLCLAAEIPEPGRLGRHDDRRGCDHRRARRGRGGQRVCQPLRPSRQPPVPDAEGPRQGDHLHLSRLEL